jgi:hypothetical protein
MTLFAQTISQAEFCRVLRRAGYPEDVLEDLVAQLPDPIDVDRDEPVLQRYGVTLDHLTDLMGGSPS